MTPWLVGALLLLLIIVGLLLRRRFAGGSPSQELATKEPGVRRLVPGVEPTVVPVGALDLDALVSSLGFEPLGRTAASPIVLPQEDGSALVVADRRRAKEWGEIVASAGTRVQAVVRRGSSAVDAATSAAERTGYLVKLHPESARKLSSLKADQVKDAAGYVYGTLRGKDGQYAHVVKLKQVGNLQTLSSGAAILSALAMQAQLDRIEKTLRRIESSVTDVQDRLDNTEDARRDALGLLFAEIYGAAFATGELTSAQWHQIAPKLSTVYELRATTSRELRGVERKLRHLPANAGDRVGTLKSLKSRLERLLENLDRDDRLVGQAHALRLWHLSTVGDKSLQVTLEQTREQVSGRLFEREQILSALLKASVDPDVRGPIQGMHIRRRRELRQRGQGISSTIERHRLPLPHRPAERALAITDGSGFSPRTPEEIANSYTLTQTEAVIVAAAQCWMMKRDAAADAGVLSKKKDVREFVAEAQSQLLEVTTPSSVVSAFVGSLQSGESALPHASLFGSDEVQRLCAASDSRTRSLVILIELAAFHPWSPEDVERPLKTAVRWQQQPRKESLQQLAKWLTGTRESDVQLVLDEYTAVVAHLRKGTSWVAVGVLGVAGLGIGVLTGGLAAPLIGAAVGSTFMGLSGAAATSAGLAALGGGSLAAGGFGMAGGTALVATVGGLTGAGILGAGGVWGSQIGDTGRAALLARTVVEVVRLQVLARVIVIGEEHDYAQLTVIVEALNSRLREVEDRLAKLAESPGDDSRDSDPLQLLADERSQLKALQRVLERGIDDLLRLKGIDSRREHD